MMIGLMVVFQKISSALSIILLVQRVEYGPNEIEFLSITKPVPEDAKSSSNTQFPSLSVDTSGSSSSVYSLISETKSRRLYAYC